MLDQSSVVQTEEQITAVVRLTIPREKMCEVMPAAVGEVMAAVAAQGIGPMGPLFSHHFRMSPETFDFEVGVPVSAPVQPVGRVQASALPATTIMRTVYSGPYEELGDAWGEFVDQIEAAGHKPAANLWECYVTGPQSGPDPTKWRTELNRPLLS